MELHTRTREQSRIANLVIRKIGHDVSVRPIADRTDSGGGGRESGVSPSGEEYVVAEVKVCISSTPLVSAVNHMAAQAIREEKTNNKKTNRSFHLILTSTLVNLDNRERARARNK